MEHQAFKILMELRSCFSGYSGIAQETRLLFSAFLDDPTIKTYGLLNQPGFQKSFKNSYKSEAHQKIKTTSQFIVSYLAESSASSRVYRFLSSMHARMGVSLDILCLLSKRFVQSSLSIGSLDVERFEHFIWESLFANTLPIQDFKKITTASYCTLQYPTGSLHFCGLLGGYAKLDTSAFDVFLTQTPFPGQVSPNTTLVVRYHDAIPLFAPHLFPHRKVHFAAHYHTLKNNAQRGIFVCSSQATRCDLLHVFPELESRAVVIHDMVSNTYFETQPSPLSVSDIIVQRSVHTINHGILHEPYRYLLMVSTIEPRKNHLRLIRAWEMIRAATGENLKLVIVGSLGWDYDAIYQTMKKWQQRDLLFHLHQVPISELKVLYQGAASVVCPSVMEGFDLTGVEAMLSGGVVVASDIAVHREVFADAAQYFDVYSPEHQAEVIQNLISKESKAKALMLREKGLQYAQRYLSKHIQPQWIDFFKDVQANKFKAF